LFLVAMFMMMGIAACNTVAEPTAVPPMELTIVATDIAYDKDRLEVKAGQPVRLTIQNEGVLEHDFSIMQMPHSGEVMAIGMVMESEHMEHDMSNMTTNPEIHVAAPQDMRNTIEFTPSEPGEYEFFCTVSGHKEAGMVGTLVVTAP
jgi:uncharacterized cupredoxin-like copper-binding protein